MKYVKMYIAGLALPGTLLPFLLLIVYMAGRPFAVCILFFHFIPLIWGLWNIFYFEYLKKVLPGNAQRQLAITGAILGFLIALLGTFFFDVPELIRLPSLITYLPLIVLPILYAILWVYIVSPINDLLGLNDKSGSWFFKRK